jgi:hypothetical protein
MRPEHPLAEFYEILSDIDARLDLLDENLSVEPPRARLTLIQGGASDDAAAA